MNIICRLWLTTNPFTGAQRSVDFEPVRNFGVELNVVASLKCGGKLQLYIGIVNYVVKDRFLAFNHVFLEVAKQLVVAEQLLSVKMVVPDLVVFNPVHHKETHLVLDDG